MCVCARASVCAGIHMCVRQTDRFATTNIALFKFKLHKFRCAYRMHNEINATGNAQILSYGL